MSACALTDAAALEAIHALSALDPSTNIVELDLCHNRLSDAVVGPLGLCCARWPGLQLDLSYNRLAGSKLLKAVATTTTISRGVATLGALSIAGHSLDGERAAAIATAAGAGPGVDLGLANCGLTKASVATLSQLQLGGLDLDHNDMAGAMAAVWALAAPGADEAPGVRRLSLRDCNLGPVDLAALHTAVAVAGGGTKPSCPALRTLDLGSNEGLGRCDAERAALARALAPSTTVRF